MNAKLNFFSCQILSFKYGKLSLRKKFNDKSLSKIPIQARAQHKKNVCSKYLIDENFVG